MRHTGANVTEQSEGSTAWYNLSTRTSPVKFASGGGREQEGAAGRVSVRVSACEHPWTGAWAEAIKSSTVSNAVMRAVPSSLERRRRHALRNRRPARLGGLLRHVQPGFPSVGPGSHRAIGEIENLPSPATWRGHFVGTESVGLPFLAKLTR